MATDPFMKAITSARQQVDRETRVHEKRMEFWAGYINAMEEVRDHPQEYGLAIGLKIGGDGARSTP